MVGQGPEISEWSPHQEALAGGVASWMRVSAALESPESTSF